MKHGEPAYMGDQPGVVTAALELISIYQGQGRYDEAENLCIQMLDSRIEVICERSRDLFMIRLAGLRHAMGQDSTVRCTPRQAGATDGSVIRLAGHTTGA